MKKEVMIVTGAGQISMAISRRMGYGKKIVIGDKNLSNAQTIAKTMKDAGYDVEPIEMDLSSRVIWQEHRPNYSALAHSGEQYCLSKIDKSAAYQG